MFLPYFENAVNSGYLKNPNDYFRSLQQAAITGSFDCTSAKYTVQEQDAIGAPTYHDIDVWLDYIVGTTSTGLILILAPLCGNAYRYLLNCWETLRALLLQHRMKVQVRKFEKYKDWAISSQGPCRSRFND